MWRSDTTSEERLPDRTAIRIRPVKPGIWSLVAAVVVLASAAEGVVAQTSRDEALALVYPDAQLEAERVFLTGQPEEYEVRDARNLRWYHAHMAPVIEEGRTSSLVAICVDVHDRRRQEAALRESEQR